MRAILVVLVVLIPAAAVAVGPCERAIQTVAHEYGVPVHLMQAMALVESGRTQPDGKRTGWPWTMNVEGQGHYFDTRAQAEAFARQTRADGTVLFDTGCFQINYRWHNEGFPSLEAMFDPMLNAEYAAQFLAALYAEVGDWMTAVGYYHSRTPEHTTRYQRKISQAMAKMPASPVQVAAVQDPIQTQRQNRTTFSGQKQMVVLQSLTPQTAGAVSVRILTPGRQGQGLLRQPSQRIIRYGAQ